MNWGPVVFIFFVANFGIWRLLAINFEAQHRYSVFKKILLSER